MPATQGHAPETGSQTSLADDTQSTHVT